MQVVSQKGSALPLSLVFLAIMGVTGVSAMRMAQADLQISGAIMDRDTALHAAELALVQAESKLFAQDFALTDFNSQCRDGLCFAGSYTPGESCQQAANRAALSDANWQNATKVDIQSGVTAEQPRFLIEFMCFQPLAGATPEQLAAAPAPSPVWQPRFRITSISTGRTGIARTTLETEYVLPAEASPAPAAVNMPAIFATNGSLTTVDGTDVAVYFCEHCSQTDVDNNTNVEQITFNPSGIDAITYGTSFTNTGWTPSYKHIGGKTGEMGRQEYYQEGAVGVGQKPGNEFFAQYFGTTDKNAVIQDRPTFAATEFGSANFAGQDIVIFDGDVDHSGVPANLASNPDAIIIIRGDLTLSGSSRLPEAALIYVEGNLNVPASSDRYTSALAVEGDATIRSSFVFFPASNPMDRLQAVAESVSTGSSGATGMGEAKRTSWRMAAL